MSCRALDHVLGNERALSDPFLTATVQPAILDTYRNEQGLFGECRRTLTLGRARRSGALAAVAQLAKAGLRIVATSDGNWAGTFQATAPADFLAVAADPLQSAQNLRHIALVIRQGKVVNRATLLPDLERRDFRP